MKTLFTLFAALICCLQAKAQGMGLDTASCIYYPGLFSPVIDTVYKTCDAGSNPNFNIVIEQAVGNCWQKGRAVKFGNMDIRDTACAIITDTANPYVPNNFSAFHFLLPVTPHSQWNNNYSYYLKFWHKFETDTLRDGCWLEFSKDSGAHWYPADSFANNFDIYRFCNLYSDYGQFYAINNFDTLLDGRKAWSGKSDGWEYSALLFNFAIPVKPGRSYGINAIRFVFQSDSISNNQAGWIINEVSTGWCDFLAGTNDLSVHNQLPVYPNPSSSGIFHISFPDHYVKGIMQVYNIYGNKILEQSLNTTLDLRAFPTGIYFYKTDFEGKCYSGVLSKQ